MSGGHFDYLQYRIREIADSIEDMIVKNKVEVPERKYESWDYDENGNLYDWSRYYYSFDDKTIEKMKEGYWKLREAEIYAQRIDWLISGDDGEDTFHERLKSDLDVLTKEKELKTWLWDGKDKDDDWS